MTLDVIVVGAGPAGTVLAGLLARAGLQVLILEAARFPRPKPCGECLNPGALRMVERLGLGAVVGPLGPVSLRGWRLCAGRRQVDLHFPDPYRAAAVDRVRLDSALADWAVSQGAVLEQGVRVRDLLFDGGRVAGVAVGGAHLDVKLCSRMVVGADGLRSFVARRLGLSQAGTAARKVAFTAHWEGVEGLADQGELNFATDGVVGIAPVDSCRANVVVVVPADRAPAVKAGGLLERWPELKPRFERARPIAPPLAVGPFHRPVRSVFAPGALLVGDAAGYYDPLTGQGIYRALLSASLAAEAAQSLLAGDPRAAAVYQESLQRAVTPGVRLQWVLDRLVRRPRLLNAGLGLLCMLPPLGSWLMGQVGDCRSPLGEPRSVPGARWLRDWLPGGSDIRSGSKE